MWIPSDWRSTSDEFGRYRVARNAYQPAEDVIDRLRLVQSSSNLCHDVCQFAIMLVGYHVTPPQVRRSAG